MWSIRCSVLAKMPLQASKAPRLSAIPLGQSNRWCHGQPNEKPLSNTAPPQLPFHAMMAHRYDQAKRTVCIEVSPESKDDLLTACGQFGSIESALPHSSDAAQYLLVEYSSVDEASNLMAATDTAADIAEGLSPLRNRFLTFKQSLGKAVKSAPQQKAFDTETRFQQSARTDAFDALKAKDTVEEQLQLLFETKRLSDTSSRLRFLAALQVEEAIAGIFANVRIMPFGSSVNGFGRLTSDLDMMLKCEQATQVASHLHVPRPNGHRQMEARDAARNTLYPLQVILQNWIPGVENSQLVSAARIPIIGYGHRIAGLECDLSIANVPAEGMANMFYTFSQLDARVQPFVLFVREWAAVAGVTAIIQPCQLFSNFMITSIAIYYLQQLAEPILPPANRFVTFETDAFGETVYRIDAGQLEFSGQNASTLEQLVVGFFEFYSSFNLEQNGISMLTGDVTANATFDPVYIVNPMQSFMNAAGIVSNDSRDMFMNKCKLSYDALTGSRYNIPRLLKTVKSGRR